MTGAKNEELQQKIAENFDQADQLLFKERRYQEAEKVYREILESDPQNVDAINSIAYSVKFQAATNSASLPNNLFENLQTLYKQALSIDSGDIEANFNLGLLYLQFNQDMNLALDAFKKCVERDDENNNSETGELFRAQFAKSYYNIGMIYDKMGQVQQAKDNYALSMKKCEKDPSKQLIHSSTYKKAGTNFAVSLEKTGDRDTAVSTLTNLKGTFGNEVRVFNNLGIIQKRKGDLTGALESYRQALKVDQKSFFPNYNLGVLLSQNKEQAEDALNYFKKALEQAQRAQESLYEINVLINIALLQESLGRLDESVQSMKLPQAIDPNNVKIQAKIDRLRDLIENKELVNKDKDQQQQ